MKSGTTYTFDAIRSDLDVQVARLQRENVRLSTTFEATKQIVAENQGYLDGLKKCRHQILQCMSRVHHLSSTVQQAIFCVFEQLGERELLLKAAVKALVEGSDPALHRLARRMILDMMDQIDDMEVCGNLLIDSLRDTFELLRRKYYETSSLRDEQKSRKEDDDEMEAKDVSMLKTRKDHQEPDPGVGMKQELDPRVRDLMAALIDLINIAMSSNTSSKTKCDVWALLCSHIDSGAWPLGQVACVSLANWGRSESEFKCSQHVLAALCGKVFHTQKPVRNAAVEALKSVPLVSSWAVCLLSRIFALSTSHGHRMSAARAITGTDSQTYSV